MRPKFLEPRASASTYRIDAFAPQSKTLAFRLSFNAALQAAQNPIDPDEFKKQVEQAGRMLDDLRSFSKSNTMDLLSSVMLPAESLREPPGTWSPDQEYERVCDRVTDLVDAIEKFTNGVAMPTYVWSKAAEERPSGNHRDDLTRLFIDATSRDARLEPFTPVTRANLQDFVRLIAAGWEDLGLPKDRGGRSYPTVYAWLMDRVRKQLGFRSQTIVSNSEVTS